MYYNNKPIERTTPYFCETPSKERKNLLLNLPIHSIEAKNKDFSKPDDPPYLNHNTDSLLLTDGDYSPENAWRNPHWFRMHDGEARCITFKLPYVCAVDGFSINFCRDDLVSVRIPRYIKIRVSADGENFQTVYENHKLGSTRDWRSHNVKAELKPIQALYIQFVLDVVNHIFIDEIELYGCSDTAGADIPVSDGKPVFHEYAESPIVNEYPAPDVIGAENITLTYNFCPMAEDLGLQTEEHYLPIAAYLSPEGEILDTFMDGYLFLPDTAINYVPDGQNAKGWKEYVDSCFVPNTNIDALNSTVGKIKDALKLPDYKVSLYFSLLYTFTGYESFGELTEGENIKCHDVESRKKAIKWMIDTMIARYTAGGYENTELKGFYWFEEVINPSDADDEVLIAFARDYVHSLGYKIFWIPYYTANGYKDWKHYGFDLASMQPNYAFTDDVPKSRLYDNAEECKKYGLCAEMEVWKIQEDENGNIDNPSNIDKFNDYMFAGVETGYMNSVKIYYHGSAPGSVITNGWKAKNPKYREMYDNCYLYAKRKLTVKK